MQGWQSIKKICAFEIFNSWNTLHSITYVVNNNNNFSFLGFSNLSFFVFVFTNLKKKMFLNTFSINLILFQVKAL